MKVLMLGRSDLLTAGMGGDRVQVENTASELRKLGIEVDIKTDSNIDLSSYDLVHVFQLDWTPETYFHVVRAKKAGKPVVLSPIHHSIKEVKKFDDNYVFDFRRITKYMFANQFHRDTYKNVYRAFFKPSRLKPLLTSIFKGMKNMHREMIELSDIILVQTDVEAKDLKTAYGVEFKWRKIQNGVREAVLNIRDYANPFSFENYIICVGRIEARKNQLNIIKAVELFREKNKLDTKLIFIGSKSTQKHFEYIFRFNRALKKRPWITHISSIPYEKMPSYYHFAKVCVSASWFETTGLTSLEALFSGTNAVAAGERAKEYLNGYASYCQPEDVDSIEAAVEKEYFAKRPVLSTAMLSEFTWKNTAKNTAQVYSDVLAQKKEILVAKKDQI